MSRGELVLLLIGALCAAVLVARGLPDAGANLGGSNLVGTIIGTVLGGVILAGLLALAWRWWREAQEVRLLRGFLKESRGNLNCRVALYKAVADAKLQDPSPVVDRLLRKRHIGPWYKRDLTELEPDKWLTDEDEIDPESFALNYEGRVRAEKERWWRPGGLW